MPDQTEQPDSGMPPLDPRSGFAEQANAEPVYPEPMIVVEPEEADDAAPRPSALRTATVVSVRVVIGLVAVAVAAATVAAAALLPLPSIHTVVPKTVVTPVATAQQLVCPGGLLRLANAEGKDATKPSALGRAALATASVGGSVDRTAFASSDADTGGGASAPQLLTLPAATGAGAGLLAGAQSQSLATDEFEGLSSSACAAATGDSWLVGGSTAVGRTTLLTLADPGEVAATVSLQIFGENGAVSSPGMDGILVPAGGQRVLSLAAFAPGLASPVVHVQSSGGQVVANLQQSTVRGLEPGGVDIVGAQSSATRTTVIPGVVLSNTSGVQSRIGESGFDDLETILRVYLPGTKATTAKVSVIPDAGTPAAPASGGSGGSDAGTPVGTAIRVDLDPGKVTDLPLDDLSDGSYTLVVTTAIPIVAGVRVSTAGSDAVSARTDFAWMATAAKLPSGALVSVAPAGSEGMTSVLHLDNPTSKAARVILNAVDGATSLHVTVPAGSAASVPVAAGASYRLTGYSTLYAAVSGVIDGGITGYAVPPPQQSSSPLDIYR